MEQTSQAIAERVKKKFGLDGYTLERTHLHREAGSFDQTHYVFNMEWFPKGTAPTEDELNPEGTASIDVDLHTERVKSLVFVGGRSEAHTATLQTEQEVIRWVETETGLTFGEHFEFKSKQDRKYMFSSVVNGISTSPSGMISVELNEDNLLIFFTIHGHFPVIHEVIPESFSLTLEDIPDLIMEQFMLVNFPLMSSSRFEPAFSLEEIYVTNDGTSTRPFRLTDAVHLISIGEVMTYEPSLDEEFHEEKINLSDEVTWEQAKQREPHPDLLPIKDEMVEDTQKALTEFLQVVYPKDSGEWIWQSVERESGYLVARLEIAQTTNDFYKRKINVFLNENGTKVLTYMENDLFREMTSHFEEAKPAVLSKQEAYHLIKDKITLTPVYVLDHGEARYRLYGKLDCEYAVDARSGEVKLLSEME
ncbi:MULTISPECIES: hypothetical protein [Pontibacillus]|uniref:DUF4901 domain-containing protein n=1 Tax=Pontibacillus chungwhensis TaxID=265426 RepID=A0ABY8V2U4_9BACI|nr:MULTISPECIES: hypothetical protein [Pontibacillus]MCD5324388.1 hypothetical protein [Pontibacillus sp. HN14]WIF99316.1 hypothetical protein QNI29_06565 [Pontibacillus chungwhensis]